MDKQILDVLWSIFTDKQVDCGTILWDDFITYVVRDSLRQGLTKVTSARFWSLCIMDLHSQAKVSMGVLINYFIYRELKRYSLPMDLLTLWHLSKQRLQMI